MVIDVVVDIIVDIIVDMIVDVIVDNVAVDYIDNVAVDNVAVKVKLDPLSYTVLADDANDTVGAFSLSVIPIVKLEVIEHAFVALNESIAFSVVVAL